MGCWSLVILSGKLACPLKINGWKMYVYIYIYMAAAQNVRSGSSPGPTHDPDLRSRPPIQTCRKDLIQTFDPDLWNDIIYWWVYVWSSNGCMFLGFLLCSYSPACQAAKQQTCCEATLSSFQAAKATLLSSPAAKLQRLCIQAVKLPSWHCCKL